jgi:hypothetical protein
MQALDQRQGFEIERLDLLDALFMIGLIRRFGKVFQHDAFL